MTKPEPYGVGDCDDCHHNALLAQYGKTRICKDCTRLRLKAQLGDEYIPAVKRRPPTLHAEKSPDRCSDCRMTTRNGAHYPGAYLCENCEDATLERMGLRATRPVDHDRIAA